MASVQVFLLALLHLAPATWSAYHILLYKRDPRAAMGWLVVCFFIPYAGPVSYFLFGINRVRSRARCIKRSFFTIDYEAGERQLGQRLVSDGGLRAIGERIVGTAAIDGNTVEAIFNGENAYPAMIESINSASSRIMFATYILKTDRTGSAFAQALEAAVSRGVEVMVLVDGIGEMYSWKRPSRFLQARGINAARFLPPKLLPPSIYLNMRNHRKLLVVDHDVAYAGGMNIGDEHVATENRPIKVTDVHFRLRGPIVDSLAEIFYHDWHFTTGVDHTNRPAAPTERRGEVGCRAIPDGPNEEMDALALTIQSVISSATSRVDIMTPYFLPSRELIACLQAAALKGVTVRVVLPALNNLFYVHWANRNMLAELLKSGIEAYYQPAPFCHSKLLCIDDDYSLIGSANLDPRSLRLNFELGIEVFDKALNTQLRSHMDQVVLASASITYEALTNRTVPARLRDSFCALFAPYL